MGERRGRRGDGDEQFRKIFIGGLNYETTDETLRSYFEAFGEITDCIVMKDPVSKRSRGFGFVTYKDKEMVDVAQGKRPHTIDGKELDTKRAMPRAESDRAEAHATVDKIFIGGMRPGVTEEALEQHFKKFGKVKQVEIMLDKNTGQPRGFGFLTFDDYDAVDQAVLTQFHDVAGVKLEARKALSKSQMNEAQERLQSRQSRRGGGDGRGRDFDGGQGNFNRGGRSDFGDRGNFNRGGGGGGGGFGNFGGGNSGGSWGGSGGFNQNYNQNYNQGGYSQGSYGGNGGSNWGGNQGGGGGNWSGNQQQQQYNQQQSWGGNQQGGYNQGGYSQGGYGGGGGPVGQDRSHTQRSGGPYGGGFGNQRGGYRR